jgi:anti-sigma factor RsiW
MIDVPCNELVEMASDYVEGALDAELVRRIDHHLLGCPGCRAYLQQLRASMAAMRALGTDDAPPSSDRVRKLVRAITSKGN